MQYGSHGDGYFNETSPMLPQANRHKRNDTPSSNVFACLRNMARSVFDPNKPVGINIPAFARLHEAIGGIERLSRQDEKGEWYLSLSS